MCCELRDKLAALQQEEIILLQKEGEAYLAEGDEYHAMLISREDLPAAQSLARLVHVCKNPADQKMFVLDFPFVGA